MCGLDFDPLKWAQIHTQEDNVNDHSHKYFEVAAGLLLSENLLLKLSVLIALVQAVLVKVSICFQLLCPLFRRVSLLLPYTNCILI